MSRLFTILTVAGLVVLLAVPAVAWAVGPEECYDHMSRRYTSALFVPDSYAYINEGHCVDVLDVTDPTHPIVISRSGREPIAQSISVLGPYLYLAGGPLAVLDVSDPCCPQETFNENWPGDLGSTAILGRHLYAGGSSLLVFDLSVPPSPQVANILWDLNSWNAAISNRRLYLANNLLQIMDLVNPVTPTAIVNYGLPHGANDVFVLDSLVYVPYGFTHKYSSFGGLMIIDVSNPTSPNLLTDYELGVPIRAVAVAANHAYLVTEADSLFILDVSDPTTPTQAGSLLHLFPPYYPSGIELVGNYAFVIGPHGLRVVDVSDPAAPVVVGVYNTSPDVTGDGDRVNVVDIQTIASLLGQEPSTVNEQMADLDGDGMVDLVDLTLAASRWRWFP